jgi:hypothetical protein
MFCTTLIGKTGLVIRGGLAIGPHYERDWEEDGSKCLFVFSKALVDAVALEKEAKTARVIIDQNLVRYLQEQGNTDIQEFVFRDPENKQCLDLYNIFRISNPDNAHMVLKNIKDRVTKNMNYSSSNSKALEKLRYFAGYHNNWVRQNHNEPELMINHPM